MPGEVSLPGELAVGFGSKRECENPQDPNAGRAVRAGGQTLPSPALQS